MSKFFKKYHGIVCFGLLFVSFHLSAQTTPYAPSVIPPSPNAASLMKFTDVPISSYTGAADVTVPVYTIQARGISIPITLSNHTGGIRLREEAGWVGLGWSLSTGGMISRQIKDKDDFEGHYFTPAVPQIVNKTILQQTPFTGSSYMGNFAYDLFCNYLINTDAGAVDFTTAWPGGSNLYDMEADVFNYNFPGKNGKFIISRAGKVLIQKQENIKVLYETNGNSFTILDEQGNMYYFMDKE